MDLREFEQKVQNDLIRRTWDLKEKLAKSIIPMALLDPEKRVEMLAYIAGHEIHWRSYPIPDNQFVLHEFLWKDGVLKFEVWVTTSGNVFTVGSTPTLPY